MNKRNEKAWDKLSEYYQNSRRLSLDNFHYGAFAPGDKELGILGDVKGLDVLDVGCGGGQNSIVLAKMGAKSVKAIDQSEMQLGHARKLAEEQGVSITFLKRNMEELLGLNDASFDLVVSSHAMNYASDLIRVFNECARVLRSKGRIVICLNHPLYVVLGQALEDDDFSKIVNYFEGIRDIWDWTNADGEMIATFESRSWRFEHIINGLIETGFVVERVAEPRGYTKEEMDELPLDAVPYQDIGVINEAFIRTNRIIPSTIIVSAIKKE
ncbi:MAG: class I SAM-dependent methyltransferase [Candidatus Thorarchaeota archaeon]